MGWLSAPGDMALLRGDSQDKVRVAARLRLGRAGRAQPSWPRGVRELPSPSAPGSAGTLTGLWLLLCLELLKRR